jgi:hypothetical protein
MVLGQCRVSSLAKGPKANAQATGIGKPCRGSLAWWCSTSTGIAFGICGRRRCLGHRISRPKRRAMACQRY